MALFKEILGLNDDYKIIFMGGGASTQFAMIPMNFLSTERFADYVNTGSWAAKAINEARILGKSVNVVASSEDKDFSYIPKAFSADPDAAYLHITSNNTIKGTQWQEFPEASEIPVFADMSSDIMSRPYGAYPNLSMGSTRPSGLGHQISSKSIWGLSVPS